MELKGTFDTLKFNFTRACVAATCKLMGDPASPGVGALIGTTFRQLFSQADTQQQLVPIPVRSFEQRSVDTPFESRLG